MTNLPVLTAGDNGVACRGRGRCCENNPGWFAPGEMEAAAAHLGMTPEAFFKQYVVLMNVRLPDEPGQPLVEAYVPTKVDEHGQPVEGAGRRVTRVYQYLRGPCVFYKEQRCAIHPVRPLECRRYFCEQADELNISHEQIGKLWYAEFKAKTAAGGGGEPGSDGT
jgi:Fe-S-cluster containining protein